MQPDTATTPKIKIGQQPSGDKKDLASIEQWDQLAFALIFRELAPKGFKKFQNGHWKGAEHADIPFLPKKKVIQCQKISAQLVRGFRDKAKQQLDSEIDDVEKLVIHWQTKLKECGLLMFGKKRTLKQEINNSKVMVNTLNLVRRRLDNTPIK